MLKVRDGTYFKTYGEPTKIELYELRHGAPLFKNYRYGIVDLTSGQMLKTFETRGLAFQFVSGRLEEDWRADVARHKDWIPSRPKGGSYRIVKVRKG